MEDIAVAAFNLTSLIGLTIGSLLFVLGINGLVEHAKNPQNPKNRLSIVLVCFVAGSLLIELKSSISMFAASLNQTEAVCFINTFEDTTSEQSCFDRASSEITRKYQERLENTNRENILELFNQKITVLLKVLQTVGVVYFIKAVFLLKHAAEGRSSITYGKVLIMIIFSTLVIDMPNTLDILILTAKKIGSM